MGLGLDGGNILGTRILGNECNGRLIIMQAMVASRKNREKIVGPGQSTEDASRSTFPGFVGRTKPPPGQGCSR
jgi:hypothetical protein